MFFTVTENPGDVYGKMVI